MFLPVKPYDLFVDATQLSAEKATGLSIGEAHIVWSRNQRDLVTQEPGVNQAGIEVEFLCDLEPELIL